MLNFNHILAASQLDPKEVRLARHWIKAPDRQRKLRDAAVQRDGAFQRYQERQRDPRVIAQLRAARYIAGFFAEAVTKETVFAGVWERVGERSKLIGDPISPDTGINNIGIVEFDTRRLEAFDPYVGRLVIAWGDGTRAWVQRADTQEKAVVEIRKEVSDPEFPGFARFHRQLHEVADLYAPWVQVLRNVRGIYLLVHRESGQQYVGSAYGTGGFYDRWCSYGDGHGGNAALKELKAPASAFDVSVLEVVGSSATSDEIFERENRWKEHLGTRAQGLNRN